MLQRLFPFLSWFRNYSYESLRIDFVSGLTVALVLIPQSMAYAQLAGLPPYYGLYASFLPPMIASLFGSSRQLATGPVAIVSLMTSASLEPLATAGSQGYVAYAILLALRKFCQEMHLDSVEYNKWLFAHQTQDVFLSIRIFFYHRLTQAT